MNGPAPVSSEQPAALQKVLLRGGVAAALGSMLGYALFYAALSQGIVMMPLPGAVIGIARDLATRRRSLVLGLWSTALAAAVQSYVVHAHIVNGFAHLGMRGWLGFIVGIGIAAWFGIGRERVESGVDSAREEPKS